MDKAVEEVEMEEEVLEAEDVMPTNTMSSSILLIEMMAKVG